jgi:hypothetical protein
MTSGVLRSVAVLFASCLLACAHRAEPVAAQPEPPPAVPGVLGGIPGGITVEPSAATEASASTEASPPIEPSPTGPSGVSEEDQKRIAAVRDREMAVLTRDPRWKAYLERSILGVTDPQVAYERGFAVGRALTERGIARLSAAHLDRWCELRLRIAETSEQACAGLWSGEFAGDSHDVALSRLSEGDLADLMRLNADAGLAELGAKEPLTPDPDALRLGLAAIVKTLSAAEKTRFDQVLTGQLTAPADHCFATKVLQGRTPKLGNALRERFLRALAVSIATPVG